MKIDGLDKSFWSGKRILLTGHSGFKGAWASLWLASMGADVTGFSLKPDTDPNLFELANIAGSVRSRFGDLRDIDAVRNVVQEAAPQIVLHMAAQPLVRRSYIDPVGTFGANVMGTVHLLEALRHADALEAVLVVTTDKVYENTEQGVSFREEDPLGGHDPYAASKAAAEIVTSSYARSFFEEKGVRVATARGGNVIGGGDFSEDRLVPDIWRALMAGQPLVLRNPAAARPWQHVLDCLCGYFTYARALTEGVELPAALNFGPPHDAAPLTVAELANAVQSALGADCVWEPANDTGPREMMTLEIDSRKARSVLGWKDQLAGTPCVSWLADWYRALNAKGDMRARTLDQIAAYEKLYRGETS
ncbi:CDP-glucose 4,6-dehydratase [Parvibaculum sp.]|uniref:CDP-glucose 4,6-dehydratase n=1 Tax=Parvibaculum sp. TaxID=2024848 RepID=UPI000C49CA54|nr:CDP-glucose 4,6-dehydratase [Parvibaculum sp.]MAM93543.1 CDP-glucose 4,6-dehydratase [Parvibaculum sp.]HCX66198.1 CDP-glucose 4,6-dehydratase [Rhodobiaceae bacterium]